MSLKELNKELLKRIDNEDLKVTIEDIEIEISNNTDGTFEVVNNTNNKVLNLVKSDILDYLDILLKTRRYKDLDIKIETL